MNNTNENGKLTRSELNTMSWRYIVGSQLNWNYERMMGSGYLFGVLPGIKKLYGDNQSEFQDMLRTQNQFFNTNAIFGNLIMGIDLGIEDAQGYSSKETVIAMKTALMGSLAGVGDSLFHVIWGAVFGSIAATLAQSGSPIGCVIWIIANIALLFGRAALLPMGYKQGVQLVTTLKDKLAAFSDAATILGITVISALIPSIIKVKIPLVLQKLDPETQEMVTTLNIQETIDKIMPALLPVILVLIAYWLLGKKRINSTIVILIFLVASVVLGALGILGS